MNILLVEDNLTIVKGLEYTFKKNNYILNYKTTFYEAKKYLEDSINKVDLIILDITLPDGNGFNLFKNYIKEQNIPTIFLTAEDGEDEIVKALNEGAEDYIVKPFRIKELLARVNKILKNYNKSSVIKVKNISFDMDKMVVKKDEEIVSLTPLELRLLHLLFLNINKVVSRNVILDRIWDLTGNDVDSHTITVYFKRIREKLGTDIIVTIKGVGYRIDGE